jgi:hypothetical protein
MEVFPSIFSISLVYGFKKVQQSLDNFVVKNGDCMI